jgi:hypothetical protein
MLGLQVWNLNAGITGVNHHAWLWHLKKTQISLVIAILLNSIVTIKVVLPY